MSHIGYSLILIRNDYLIFNLFLPSSLLILLQFVEDYRRKISEVILMSKWIYW